MHSNTSALRLYIDSANEEDWQYYLSTGIFYGVTTNPKLLRATGIDFKLDRLAEMAETAFGLGAHEIHMQVWGQGIEQMLEIGRELAGVDDRVMVKVPISKNGVLCARQLITEGANITLTALHAAQQALIAVALGARYAAPYLGRMTDGGLDGMGEVTSMARIVAAMDSPMRLLVASIRQIDDLVKLSERGLDSFTLLPSLVDTLLENDLTQKAVEAFEAAVQ